MKKTVLKETIKAVLRHKLNEVSDANGVSLSRTPYKNRATSKEQYGVLTGKEEGGEPIVLVVGYGTMKLSTLKKETVRALESVTHEAEKGNYENVEYLLEPRSIVMLFVRALREVSSVAPLKESSIYKTDNAVDKIVFEVENDLITCINCDSSPQEIDKNVINLVTKKAKELGLEGQAYDDATKEALKRLSIVSNSPNLKEQDSADSALGSSDAALGTAIAKAVVAGTTSNPADQQKIVDLEKRKKKLMSDNNILKAKMAMAVRPLKTKLDYNSEKLGRIDRDIEQIKKSSHHGL